MPVFISVVVQIKDEFFLNLRFENSAKKVYHSMGLIVFFSHSERLKEREKLCPVDTFKIK